MKINVLEGVNSSVVEITVVIEVDDTVLVVPDSVTKSEVEADS